MANSGNIIIKNDFRQLENLIWQVLGPGSGNSGYGQYGIFPYYPRPLNVLQASDFSLFFTGLNRAWAHQHGVNFTDSELPYIYSGYQVNSSVINKYIICANNVINSRLMHQPSSMMYYNNFYSLKNYRHVNARKNITRSIDSTLVYNWVDANNARWFFNSSGQIRINIRHEGIPGVNQYPLASITNKVGMLNFSAYDVTKTGSGGNVYPAGYYNIADGGDWYRIFTVSGPLGFKTGYGYSPSHKWKNGYGIVDISTCSFDIYVRKNSNNLFFKFKITVYNDRLNPGTIFQNNLYKAHYNLINPVLPYPNVFILNPF